MNEKESTDLTFEDEVKFDVESKPKELTTKDKANEIVDMLIAQAHTKLKSGEDLTASEMKVCLDVCKTYGTGIQSNNDIDIVSELPFDNEDRKL
jgi:hypothetical protein